MGAEATNPFSGFLGGTRNEQTLVMRVCLKLSNSGCLGLAYWVMELQTWTCGVGTVFFQEPQGQSKPVTHPSIWASQHIVGPGTSAGVASGDSRFICSASVARQPLDTSPRNLLTCYFVDCLPLHIFVGRDGEVGEGGWGGNMTMYPASCGALQGRD